MKALITGITGQETIISESPPSKCQWAYLAGIFDGEGSVSLMPVHKSQTFQLCVTVVCGTHREAIQSVADMIGCGTVRPHGSLKDMNGKGNKKPAWRLRIYSGFALWFLMGVRPFLLIKKKQAQLGIKHQTGKYRGMRCTEERAKSEASAKAQLTALNKRGVK